MRHAWLIALKDLRLLLRDKVALFWVLGFPLVFAVFFGAVLSAALDRGDRPTPIAFVDEDRSESSARLAERLRASGAFELELRELAAARSLVQRGDRVAFLRVPRGFGAGLGVPGADGQRLELGVDPARKAEAAFFRGAIVQRLASEAAQARAPAGAPRAAAPLLASVEQSVVLPNERGPRNGFDLMFPASVLWGLIGCTASFAVAMVVERRGGTYLRLRTAPISSSAILAGKALACFVACLVDAALLVALGRFGFGVVPESWGLLWLAVVCAALCFVGLTVLLSVLGRTEQGVAGAGWATLILFSMLGGGMVPLTAMPTWLTRISDVSPVKWGIFALEGAIWRGFTLKEQLVPCGVLLGTGAVCFILGLEVLSRERT
jgi:ABC-2 type transport system permease protein